MSGPVPRSGGERAPHPTTPEEAISALREGNERHQRGEMLFYDHSPIADRSRQQAPFAAIVTCADSRVAPTLIFDVEPGNLFVSRVAGNSAQPGTVGTTEYAVAVLGVKAVVVLGHSDCGAVQAAMEVAADEASYPAETHGMIGRVLEGVVPAIESIPAAERTVDGCIEANARAQASGLASREPVIAPAVAAGKLVVVPAVFDIPSRRVSFL